MAFVDEIEIEAEAGPGGPGVVRWRQEKFIDRGGPNGGDGGKGGDVYAEAIADVFILAQYKSKRHFKAGAGDAGAGASKTGSDGADLTIYFPVGSVIENMKTGSTYELLRVGDRAMILKGGRGGYGNEHFKSPTRRAPERATLGRPGEAATFKIELSLFADVGLVGFPNAGKSSFLNSLTHAKAKVGDYAFTTLDPNLGNFYGHTIADIPGLIEGASVGKGLGTKFLRHITKTRLIAHMVSFEHLVSGGATGMKKAYQSIRKELDTYGRGITDKPEIVILTKTDLVPPETVEKEIAKFNKLGKVAVGLSLYDNNQIKKVSDMMTVFLEKEGKV